MHAANTAGRALGGAAHVRERNHFACKFESFVFTNSFWSSIDSAASARHAQWPPPAGRSRRRPAPPCAAAAPCCGSARRPALQAHDPHQIRVRRHPPLRRLGVSGCTCAIGPWPARPAAVAAGLPHRHACSPHTSTPVYPDGYMAKVEAVYRANQARKERGQAVSMAASGPRA